MLAVFRFLEFSLVIRLRFAVKEALFMRKRVFIALLSSFAFAGQTRAQEIIIARETPPKASEQAAPVSKQQTITQPREAPLPEKQAGPAALTVDQMRRAGALAGERAKRELYLEPTSTLREHDSHTVKTEPLVIRAMAQPKPREEPTSTQRASGSHTVKPEPVPVRAMEQRPREEEPVRNSPSVFVGDTAFTKLANGFDFPVGKPDAQGYYKARGFHAGGHLGEDWDGIGGGDTDLGDAIYSIGDGVVVFARDCHMGWGNVVIVRHAYREGGGVKNIDSLYGHLQKILVRRGEIVRRGQQIATLGNAHGLYDAHLHFEIRKNLEIGMSRDKFAQNASNYYDPSQFILLHRSLQSGGSYRVAMNTFIDDAKIQWDKLHNYSHSNGGGSRESASALKKALATQSTTAERHD
jgi:murein DD-endopeptidase MepM/ murein hydrolase activator NlpD